MKIFELAQNALRKKAELKALRESIAELQERENNLHSEIVGDDIAFSQEFGRLADIANEKPLDHVVIVEMNGEIYTIRYKEFKGLVVSSSQILMDGTEEVKP